MIDIPTIPTISLGGLSNPSEWKVVPFKLTELINSKYYSLYYVVSKAPWTTLCSSLICQSSLPYKSRSKYMPRKVGKSRVNHHTVMYHMYMLSRNFSGEKGLQCLLKLDRAGNIQFVNVEYKATLPCCIPLRVPWTPPPTLIFVCN